MGSFLVEFMTSKENDFSLDREEPLKCHAALLSFARHGKVETTDMIWRQLTPASAQLLWL